MSICYGRNVFGPWSAGAEEESSQTGVSFREEGGGIAGPEADDDRSASPLMCTYLPMESFVTAVIYARRDFHHLHEPSL